MGDIPQSYPNIILYTAYPRRGKPARDVILIEANATRIRQMGEEGII
jgi:hypothetical protein